MDLTWTKADVEEAVKRNGLFEGISEAEEPGRQRLGCGECMDIMWTKTDVEEAVVGRDGRLEVAGGWAWGGNSALKMDPDVRWTKSEVEDVVVWRDGLFACTKCETRREEQHIAFDHYLRKHTSILNRSQEGRFVCPLCPSKRYWECWRVAKHYREKHTDLHPFECRWIGCSQVFKYSSSRGAHEKSSIHCPTQTPPEDIEGQMPEPEPQGDPIVDDGTSMTNADEEWILAAPNGLDDYANDMPAMDERERSSTYPPNQTRPEDFEEETLKPGPWDSPFGEAESSFANPPLDEICSCPELAELILDVPSGFDYSAIEMQESGLDVLSAA